VRERNRAVAMRGGGSGRQHHLPFPDLLQK